MARGFDPSQGKHRLKQNDLYSAPRSFDIATMLVVTSAFALLFTCMTMLDAPSGTFAYFAGLVTTVGIAQSLYSVRYDPRSVSFVAGTVYHIAVTMLLFVLVLFFEDRGFRSGDAMRLDLWLCPMFAVAFVSPGIGYLSGALVAGTFLVADYLRSFLGILHLNRNPADEEQEVRSPWDE